MSRLIYRDSFARHELHRQTYFNTSGVVMGCKWCGAIPQTKTGRKYLYQYWYERDAIRSNRNYVNGFFCSVECMRTYHT
jgi:hypothetical protein